LPALHLRWGLWKVLSLSGDFDSRTHGDKIVELDYVDVTQADTASAGRCADEVFTIGAVDVDVAVFARFVVILFTVESVIEHRLDDPFPDYEHELVFAEN